MEAMTVRWWSENAVESYCSIPRRSTFHSLGQWCLLTPSLLLMPSSSSGQPLSTTIKSSNGNLNQKKKKNEDNNSNNHNLNNNDNDDDDSTNHPNQNNKDTNKVLITSGGGRLFVVSDPNTYAAVVYTPPLDVTRSPSSLPSTSNSIASSSDPQQTLLPLLLVLHGAGRNDQTLWMALVDPRGEHAGLAPSLLATERGGGGGLEQITGLSLVSTAPPELANNFIVVTPYAAGKRSFYEDSRSKLLKFLDWIQTSEMLLPYRVDTNRIALFGFSDGATVAVELATTRQFRAVAVAAYGFSGSSLPDMALERLTGIPFWVFHSADDVIFPVVYSDRLVRSLRQHASIKAGTGTTGGGSSNNNSSSSAIRYTRYESDPIGFKGSVRGHSTGIAASKDPELYRWMLESMNQ